MRPIKFELRSSFSPLKAYSIESLSAVSVNASVSNQKKTHSTHSFFGVQNVDGSHSACRLSEWNSSWSRCFTVWVSVECFTINVTVVFDCSISLDPLGRLHWKLHHLKDADPRISNKRKFDRFRWFSTEICDDREGCGLLDSVVVGNGILSLSENNLPMKNECQLAPAQVTCLEWLGTSRSDEARQRHRCFRNGTSWSPLEHDDAS